MSNSNQKMRRNAASPSMRHGPLRATQQFVLVNGSPARKQPIPIRQSSSSSSPTSKANRLTKARSHSETGFVSDRRSPIPSYKVAKPQALRAGGSLDNINLYLSGQWPKDGCGRQRSHDSTAINSIATSSILQHNVHNSSHSYCTGQEGMFKKDEQTQTSDDWEDGNRLSASVANSHSTRFVLYKRSKSVGSGDSWNLKSKDIKARLQRKDNSGGIRSSQTNPRFSPVPVITTTLSPFSSQPIKIPSAAAAAQGGQVLRGTPGKARASVEGLNTEVEKLIISSGLMSLNDDDTTYTRALGNNFDYPDGHRAPVPCLLNSHRSVDTQTPSQHDLPQYNCPYENLGVEPLSDYNSGRSSSHASTDTEDLSRPQSISPSSFMIGTLDIDENDSEIVRTGSTSANSPRPNSGEFRRLPPDGAEKLKIVDEIASVPIMKNFLKPPMMSVGNLQPSERSAFSSLNKATSAIMRCKSPILQESH